MYKLLLLPCLAAFLFGCSQNHSSTDLATGFVLKWQVISNQEKNVPESHAILRIINSHPEDTLRDNWQLFFNHAPRKVRKVIGPARLTQISGDYYSLLPQKGFLLEPNDSLDIHYYMAAWLIKETDGPRGPYLLFPGRKDSIQTHLGYEIMGFDQAEQIHRHKDDAAEIPTPQWQYRYNQSYGFAPSSSPEQWVDVGEEIDIFYESELQKEAEYLADALKDLCDLSINLTQNAPEKADISLRWTSDGANIAESYFLRIQNKQASVRASSAHGIFNGIQDLLRSVEISPDRSGSLKLKALAVFDHPRFSYRGLHLDVARNFQKIKTVKKLIDLMAFYKLNVLHFHLTEDEGWRLQIPGLPELTDIGAFRRHASRESDYLHPSYGSGPFDNRQLEKMDSHSDPSYGSGFYSREEFIDLLIYARSRHIDIIPEINFPGHARAAIKAMNVRHDRLMAEGKKEEAEKYWLIDPADSSVYLSAQHYTDNVSCVCKESVFDFYAKVLDEVINMYEEADAPLKIVHTGGDEVPAGAWEGSPICREFLKEHPKIKDFAGLEKYFHRRLANIFARRKLQLAGWEEIAMNKDGRVNPEFVSDSFLCYVWNNLWGAQDLGHRLANQGYPVVFCQVTNLYFDLAYNKDPQEPGLYWGGFVDTRDAFSFMPHNIFTSTRVDNMGHPIGDFQEMEALTKKGKANIKGIQAQLWSETIEGPDMLEYYVLPKLMGLAAVAWKRSLEGEEGLPHAWELRQERWREKAWQIGREDFPILNLLHGGYGYRIPPPGAIIKNDSLYANSLYPGLEIRYEWGNTAVSEQSPIYEGPIQADGPIRLATFIRSASPDKYRSSREVVINTPVRSN